MLNSPVDPYDSIIKLSQQNNLNHQQNISAPNVTNQQPGHVSKAKIDEVNKENAENARKIAAEIRESIVESNNEDIQVEKSENTSSIMLGLVAYSDSDSDSE